MADFECLLVFIAKFESKIMAKIEASNYKVEVLRHTLVSWLDVDQAKTEANHEKWMAAMKASHERMNVSVKTTEDCQMKQGKEEIKMEACLEEMKVEIVGHLAVRRCGRPKKRTQGDGGSLQKLAVARGRLTRRAVPAWRRGRSRRGPGKTTGNGMTGQSRRLELRLGSRKILYEARGQTPELEFVKRAVGISSGFAESE
jgi:hypothetical protein